MQLPSLRAAVAQVVLLTITGCAPEPNPLVSTGRLEDLERIPQDAAAFVTSGGIPEFGSHEHRREILAEYWYGPWERDQPETCTPEEFGWAAAAFPRQPTFGPNLLEVPATLLESVVAIAALDSYPSRADRAIAVRNASLRALPSHDPFFHDFRRAGEGYPFDYNQNSAVWAGTPLFLTHASLDRRFVAVETPYACGWIDARDIAFVDEDFVSSYRARGLAAILRDRIPVASDGTGFLFEGRVGMLLPLEAAGESETRLLAPVADGRRRALLAPVAVSSRDAAPVPLAFSGKALAKIINEIVGQPYGWGGLGGYRDCSSTLLDVLLPFGLPLPRNSSQQAVAGKTMSLKRLEPAGKEARIAADAAPFRTILSMPGHVMLYLGTFEGVPAAFHTIWGLRTQSANGSNPGRHVIGRSVITSLSPGLELPALAPGTGDLLGRIESLTLLGESQGR